MACSQFLVRGFFSKISVETNRRCPLPVMEFKVDDLFFSSPKSRLIGVTSWPAFSVENSSIPWPNSGKCFLIKIKNWMFIFNRKRR
jgi:hypothetical protein